MRGPIEGFLVEVYNSTCVGIQQATLYTFTKKTFELGHACALSLATRPPQPVLPKVLAVKCADEASLQPGKLPGCGPAFLVS